MPGVGQPIVVGGGIGLGTPSDIDHFLKLTSASPPTANTSNRLLEQATSIVCLGDGTNSTSIGNAADANDTDHIAIGNGVVTRAGTGRSLCIGQSIAIPAGSGSNNIYLGSVTFSGIVAGSDSIVIGQTVTVSSTANSSSVSLGNNSTISGNSSVAIGNAITITGNGSVAVGASAQAGLNSISIGQLATTGTGGAANSINIGTSSTGPATVSAFLNIGNRNGAAGTITAGDIILGHQDNSNSIFSLNLWLGGGPDHKASTTVPAFTIKMRQASGTNLSAGSVTWTPQRGSGTGAASSIILQSASTVASGTTLHTVANAFRVDPDSNITLAGTAGSYGAGKGVVFLANAITNPSSNPTGGGILYVNAGALTYRGSAGTTSVIAPA